MLLHRFLSGATTRSPPFPQEDLRLQEADLPYRVHALDHTTGELDSEAFGSILVQRNQFDFCRIYSCISVGLLPMPFCSGYDWIALLTRSLKVVIGGGV
jgi:hypothetical protein